MRILGGMAALAICLLLGMSRAATLNIRRRIMRTFSIDMRALADEMEYRPRDIGNMAQGMYEGGHGKFWREFAANISGAASGGQAWIQTARAQEGFSLLSTGERNLIEEAGSPVCGLDIEGSVRALRHLSERAEGQADELDRQNSSRGAMYQKLGLLSGLAVMLLII